MADRTTYYHSALPHAQHLGKDLISIRVEDGNDTTVLFLDGDAAATLLTELTDAVDRLRLFVAAVRRAETA